MNDGIDKRREKRLNYNWPIWFSEDYSDDLSQGQMMDISSEGAAFTCYADKCPHSGEEIMARFSVPSHGPDSEFDLENFIRKGYVCRIEEISSFIRKVAIQFAEPLPFKPGEVEDDDQVNEFADDDQAEEPTTFEEYERIKRKLQPANADQAKYADLIRSEAAAMARGHYPETLPVEIM